MLNSIKNTIMAGIYISIGAIVYLLVPDKTISSLFFSIGIFLVLNYHNMLLTKVIPMFFAKLDYTLKDIAIAFLGNSIGCVIIGVLISLSRVSLKLQESLVYLVDTKLNDNFISLFIMSIFCGCLVAYASLTAKKYKNRLFCTNILCVVIYISICSLRI